VGYGLRQGWHNWSVRINQSLQYLFLNRQPIALMQFADPFNEQLRISEHALYAQDQWTVHRLTLNLGGRFDTFNSWVRAQNIAAGRAALWAPARSRRSMTFRPGRTLCPDSARRTTSSATEEPP
jgi:outer membrane receptor protein involved in Fe transport